MRNFTAEHQALAFNLSFFSPYALLLDEKMSENLTLPCALIQKFWLITTRRHMFVIFKCVRIYKSESLGGFFSFFFNFPLPISTTFHLSGPSQHLSLMPQNAQCQCKSALSSVCCCHIHAALTTPLFRAPQKESDDCPQVS